MILRSQLNLKMASHCRTPSCGASLSLEDRKKLALKDLSLPLFDGTKDYTYTLIYKGKNREVFKAISASEILAVKYFDNPFVWRIELENHLLFRGIEYFPKFVWAGNDFSIAMEFIEGDDLSKLKCLGISQLLHIFLQIAKGLQIINRKGYSYVDIKPDNIRVCGKKVYLLDLGSIMPFGGDGIIMTTRTYNDPQMLSGSKPSDKLDVWALGALILEMRNSNYTKVTKYWRHPSPDWALAIPDLLEEIKQESCCKDPLGKFVLNRMMVVDLEKRANIDEVVEFLERI